MFLIIGIVVMIFSVFMYKHYAYQGRESIGVIWSLIALWGGIVVIIECIRNIGEIVG